MNGGLYASELDLIPSLWARSRHGLRHARQALWVGEPHRGRRQKGDAHELDTHHGTVGGSAAAATTIHLTSARGPLPGAQTAAYLAAHHPPDRPGLRGPRLSVRRRAARRGA